MTEVLELVDGVETVYVLPPVVRRYARFNLDGQITSILTMPEDMDHPFDDLLPIDEDVTAQSHYVDVAAQLVLPFTTAEQLRYEKRPAYLARWDGQTKEWQDLRGLEEIRAAKWVEIKNAREIAEFSTFNYEGQEFDCDRESVARLMGAVQLASLALSTGQEFEIAWTLADNSVTSLTGMQLVGVGRALALHVQGQHARARALREQIQAAQSVEELETIRWVA